MHRYTVLALIVVSVSLGAMAANQTHSEPEPAPPTKVIPRAVPAPCLAAIKLSGSLDKLNIRYEHEVISPTKDTPNDLAALTMNRDNGERQTKANVIDTEMRAADSAGVEILAQLRDVRTDLATKKEECTNALK